MEEHILACGACAASFERLLRLTSVLQEMVRSGGLAFPVTTSLSAELQAAGLGSRSCRLAPETLTTCGVGADDIYALTTLEANLEDVEHLDLTVSMPNGVVRMKDVPFDRALGLVGYVMPSSRLRPLPSGPVTIVLLAIGADGERPIGRHHLRPRATGDASELGSLIAPLVMLVLMLLLVAFAVGLVMRRDDACATRPLAPSRRSASRRGAGASRATRRTAP